MEAIFELLMDTAAALRARGSKNYDAMLVKIHVEWRHKLNYLLGRFVSLLKWPDTTFNRKVCVPANMAGHYI